MYNVRLPTCHVDYKTFGIFWSRSGFNEVLYNFIQCVLGVSRLINKLTRILNKYADI